MPDQKRRPRGPGRRKWRLTITTQFGGLTGARTTDELVSQWRALEQRARGALDHAAESGASSCIVTISLATTPEASS